MHPEGTEKTESNVVLYRKLFFDTKSVILILEP